MSFEVDIRAVGEKSQSGDALAFRYGSYSLGRWISQKTIVIDGGFEESGRDLVDHIKTCYDTTHVDLVISTHPDADHSSGLRVVLDELSVARLWMHRPWRRARAIREYIEDGRTTARSLTEQLQKSLDTARQLEGIASRKRIPIIEPFAGLTFEDRLIVLGPSEKYYESLAAEFGDSAISVLLGHRRPRASIFDALKRAGNWVRETWDSDALVEPIETSTSPQNNSSVILLARLDSDLLFTGDAGVAALNNAADFADSRQLSLADLDYFQVPHHGSKRNLGPSILNRLLGPILPPGQTNGKMAFISAAQEGVPKHPSQRVKNALIRRGLSVAQTFKERPHLYGHSDDVPRRVGAGPISFETFAHAYEEEDT